MISVSHLSIHFGTQSLFDDISFLVQPRDKIGLTGRNGSGKSTLLRILSGEQQPEQGVIAKPNEYTIGYLKQDGLIPLDKTVYAEAETALKEQKALEAELDKITEELGIRTDYESDGYDKLLHRLHDVNDRFHMLGGHSMRADVERVLTGLGFLHSDLDRPTAEFSGGWQMRIELAKILLARPNCILLDEPTNHLDIESIQWLEEFLANYEGAVVLVSHDRAFLDVVTKRTIEIINGRIEDYSCNYSRYVEQRMERMDIQKSAYENQQSYLKQQERFIERFRSKASLATRVQSRIKLLDKIDRIELEDDDTSSIHFRFPDPPRSGRTVVEATAIEKSYGTAKILRGIDLIMERGDRIAFVGKNGEGKSTLSKIIAGVEPLTSGEMKLGSNVQIGYFAQHQAEMLESNSTVFEVIDSVAAGEMRTRVRSLLGAFLFSGDAVNKKVRVLSGGERGRLALAKLLLQPSNLLILDEPTNHLDMRSKDVLKSALLDFEGTLIVVSHDREFLEGLTNKCYEFKVGKTKEYDGDIAEFLRERKLESLRELEKKSEAKSNARTNAQADTKKEVAPEKFEMSPHERERLKQIEKIQRQLQREIENAEKRIAEQESEIGAMEKKLEDAEFFKNSDYNPTLKRYEQSQKELVETMERWTKLSEELELLKSSH